LPVAIPTTLSRLPEEGGREGKENEVVEEEIRKR
jgi:hypothetical protein